ncbi:MAG TPA: translocation/assembly module TamB domain-containing protein [Candidatus Dormibacteraeota bacterium]|nr:translocation/assembly module TamB domain-containing protein [Candidatus Dormibacteraeota bacterium]
MKKWKKIVLWGLAVVVVLLLGTVVTLVLLLDHNEGFRRSILAKVENSIRESTGARLEVRDFNLRLSNLSMDLYNIVVHGREADLSQPLLAVDHLQVGLTIDSLLNRKWHVRDIIVDHPVVRMAVNKAGENNLPKPEKKSTSSNTNVFDLAIRELRLNNGEIYYNDQKTPLEADLHNFAVNANYDSTQKKYSGDLGYSAGKIVYGKYAPVEHNLQAKFGVTPQQFTLDKLDLATGGSHVALSATVNDYSSPSMEATGGYEATLVTNDFKRILKDPSLPGGTVKLTGQMKYQADPNRPMLETVFVAGNVSSAGLDVKTPSLQTEVRDLYAHYQLSGGNAEVKDIRAQIMGGTLNGKLTIRDVAGASIAQLQASLKGLSLDQAQAATHNASMRQAHLSGRVDADANAHWAKTFDNVVAHSDATIKASIGQGQPTPLNGIIHADYAAATKQLALTDSYIRTPQTSINLNGKISDRSQLQVAVQSNDLHELETLAAALQKPAPGQPPAQPLGLYGTANVNATVSGSLNAPQINGQMDARNFRVKGSSWKVLHTAFTANPSQVTLSNGDLEAAPPPQNAQNQHTLGAPAPQGRINFSAQAKLKQWAYTSSSPITANISASQISIADLERLVNKTYPVSGTLAMNVSVHGSQLNPIGQGTITVTKAKVSTESIQNLSVKFEGDGSTVKANLTVQMPAGTARADIDYFPKTEGYDAHVQAQNFRLEKLQTVQARNMQIAGGVNLNVSGKGTVKDPQLQATIEVPQLQMQKQTVQGLKFQTTVQNHVATIALDSEVAKVFIKARGTVGIDTPYMADVHLDSGKINFQPLVALYAPEQAADLSGQTELHVTLRGPLADKNRLEAHLEIPNLDLHYKQFQLAAVKTIRVDYQNGTATLQPASIRGTGTSIEAQAVVPVTTTNAASFLVQGNVDLGIAQLFVPDLTSSGQLQFDLDSKRYGGGTNLNGHIKVVNANLHTADSPVGLDDANGVINVTQTRLEIASFEGQMGGGTINATGAVVYRPAIQFHLGLAANNIRVRYPEGVRAILASNLALTGNTEESQLSGQVKIQRVSFTPDFDLSTFASQFSGEASDSGTPGAFTQGMKLNIAVQSTGQVNLASSQVSLRGDANLRVVGTASDPVILGRTNLTGGEFFLAGSRYQIEHGMIDFLNPVRTEPVLNIQVKTRIDQYNITLALSGPVERLQTTYTSDPALPPVDIINLLASGRTVESAAANPSPSPTSALGAQSLLASGISGQVSGRIAKFAGVSQLQVDPGLGTGTGQNPGARVAIQQRVTSDLLVTFASDITSTQRQAIQVEYKLNPKWSVSGTRDQNGGFGLDGRYRKDF